MSSVGCKCSEKQTPPIIPSPWAGAFLGVLLCSYVAFITLDFGRTMRQNWETADRLGGNSKGPRNPSYR